MANSFVCKIKFFRHEIFNSYLYLGNLTIKMFFHRVIIEGLHNLDTEVHEGRVRGAQGSHTHQTVHLILDSNLPGVLVTRGEVPAN